MVESVSAMVERWARASGKSQHLLAIRDLLSLLATELYSQYQPFPESPPFWDRLRAWLENVPDGDDRKQLFEFVPWLLFVGRRELEVMYRAAFSGPITRWIIDEASLDITASDFNQRFQDAVHATFFGSMAGMDIGSFVRVNGLRGQSLRPDFRVLTELGDLSAIQQHLCDGSYERIVAVEDFVGSGEQMEQAANGLTQFDRSILLCPIIIAPLGVETGKQIVSANTRVSFSPMFVLPRSATVPTSIPIDDSEPQELSNLRMIAVRTYQQVEGSIPDRQLHGPFGFRDTGSLVMTYLNCPDNVPPLIHHLSDTWEPLFRRMYREA